MAQQCSLPDGKLQSFNCSFHQFTYHLPLCVQTFVQASLMILCFKSSLVSFETPLASSHVPQVPRSTPSLYSPKAVLACGVPNRPPVEPNPKEGLLFAPGVPPKGELPKSPPPVDPGWGVPNDGLAAPNENPCFLHVIRTHQWPSLHDGHRSPQRRREGAEECI